jgi:hypothetical protein
VESLLKRRPLVIGLAAVVVGGLAVLAYLFISGGDEAQGITCATGPLAENQADGAGMAQFREEEFATLLEAQRFLCLPLSSPSNLEAWRLAKIVATRSHSLDQYPHPDGSRRLLLTFSDDRPSTTFGLQILTNQVNLTQGSAAPQIVQFGNVTAEVRQGGPRAELISVLWTRDDLTYLAVATLGDGFGMAELIQVLESIP